MRSSISCLLRCSVVLAILFSASSARAGSCYCEGETYSRFLLKTATPQEISECESAMSEEGIRPHKITRDDALSCLSGMRYQHVSEDAGSVEGFRLGVDALVAAGEAQMLLRSQAYRDPAVRAKVRPLMVRTRNAELWDTLVKASDGDKAAYTQALYLFCDKYGVIVELLAYGQSGSKLTLEQFWPLPPRMKPRQARQRLKCAYAQPLLMDAAIRSLEGELEPEALSLLSAKQLRTLRNAVYARHGRPFTSKDLRAFFSARPGYREDPAYTDARLTPVDKRNLEIIQQVEKKAR